MKAVLRHFAIVAVNSLVLLVFLAGTTRVAVRHSSLWGLMAIDVPAGVQVSVVPHNLGPQDYVFTSDAKGQALLIAYVNVAVSTMAADFLDSRERLSASSVEIHGMHARIVRYGPYVRVDIRLPKAAACPVQAYALFVYTYGDDTAASMVKSLKYRPGSCLRQIR